MFTPDNLPNLLKEFEQFKETLLKTNPSSMWPHIDKIQGAVKEAHDSLPQSKQKEVLGEMLAKAAQSRKEIEKEAPKLLAEARKEIDTALAWVKDFAAELKQTEKTFEEKQKAEQELAASLQAPPPVAPDAPLDPKHGIGMALELLQALGMLETKKPDRFDDGGSIAKHWNESEEVETSQISPPAPPPPTPAPAAPGSGIFKAVRKKTNVPKSPPPKSPPPKGGDAWEGLSQADE